MMRRRVLTFLLAGLVVLGSVLSCLPLRASAIVPLGFVQSALASYVSSTGYKLYNDNGTGEDILGSLGELYDDYVTVSNKTITGQLANLAFLANSLYIYQDNSGQIVISKVAADIFQDFAEWIQSEYNVTVGSDTPTAIYSGGQTVFSDGNGTNCWKLVPLVRTAVASGVYSYLYTSYPVGTYNGQDVYFGTSNANGIYYITQDPTGKKISIKNGGSGSGTAVFFTKNTGNNYYTNRFQFGNGYGDGSKWYTTTETRVVWSVPISDASALSTAFGSFTESGVVGLGVTLAQAVADVIGQAKEDDAVVIGVGASVGATAQDIADMVAQGVKAQTLDPSVSITAESVIDTPVQPYPDIDGLGLPELGAALVSRFPFCIPWDFVDTVKLLNAEPVAPDIAVDLFPAAFKSKVGVTGSTEFRINLGDEKYQKIGTFCRWGSLIGFCFGLAMLTKRMIWTA